MSLGGMGYKPTTVSACGHRTKPKPTSEMQRRQEKFQVFRFLSYTIDF